LLSDSLLELAELLQETKNQKKMIPIILSLLAIFFFFLFKDLCEVWASTLMRYIDHAGFGPSIASCCILFFLNKLGRVLTSNLSS
jgi:hypothetical protein